MGDMSVLILDLGPLKASYPRLDGILDWLQCIRQSDEGRMT